MVIPEHKKHKTINFRGREVFELIQVVPRPNVEFDDGMYFYEMHHCDYLDALVVDRSGVFMGYDHVVTCTDTGKTKLEIIFPADTMRQNSSCYIKTENPSKRVTSMFSKGSMLRYSSDLMIIVYEDDIALYRNLTGYRLDELINDDKIMNEFNRNEFNRFSSSDDMIYRFCPDLFRGVLDDFSIWYKYLMKYFESESENSSEPKDSTGVKGCLKPDGNDAPPSYSGALGAAERRRLRCNSSMRRPPCLVLDGINHVFPSASSRFTGEQESNTNPCKEFSASDSKDCFMPIPEKYSESDSFCENSFRSKVSDGWPSRWEIEGGTAKLDVELGSAKVEVVCEDGVFGEADWVDYRIYGDCAFEISKKLRESYREHVRNLIKKCEDELSESICS